MTTPTYKSGSTVSVSLPIPAQGEETLELTAVSVVIHDEDGVVVGTLTPDLPTLGDDIITFDVPVNLNLLSPDARKGARQVMVSFVSPRGTFVEVTHYLLESNILLTVLKNTFQTYPEALMTRSDLPILSGWDAASDSARIATLQLAHAAMCNLRYRYRIGLNGQTRLTGFPGTFNTHNGIYSTITDIRNTLPFEWAEFPEDFKDALRRAQIVEANVLLQGDPVGEKRRAGIVSESIGEASMFFKQVPEVSLAISREALQHLRGYATLNMSVARA